MSAHGSDRGVRAGSSRIGRLRPALAAGTVAVGLLLLTVVTAVGSWYRADLRADRTVTQGGEVVVNEVEQAIESAEARLVAAAGLFRASEEVTREEFATFVEDIALAEGMGGIGYIALVPSGELDDFSARVAAELPGYRVFELDSEDGGRVPVGPRPFYYPLQWFEPEEAFDRPHGFDSGSDPTRLAALERAATTDRMIASPFVRLFSEADQDGFVMYRRVVDPNTGAVEGFTVSGIDVGELLAARIPESVGETVTWQVTDVTSTSDNSNPSSEFSRLLSVGGRTWRVEVAARDGSPLATDAEQTLLVLIGGLLVSLSAATVAYLLYRRSETNRELEHLRDLTLAKDRFLASVSHELRTPLTGVLGYAELLRDHNDSLPPEDRQAMIRSVADQALDLGHIIEDLLVAARTELNQLTIAKVPVCPQAQVAQVIEAYGADIAAKVKVVDQLPPPLRALGDPSRVRQIIRNLINNASRYGGPRIEVRIDEVDQMIHVDIADNGPPLPGDATEKIFEPYQRAHHTSGQPDSVGIGLSIARTLARLMDGDVTYRCVGNWNIFRLSLPPASLQPEPVAAAADRSSAS